MSVFKIKVCGITNPKDALAVQQFGADAIGLNFYSKSLRSVTMQKAEAVVEAIADDMIRVGVFVNMATEKINSISSQFRLNYIQLHGNESPDQVTELSAPVIRAVRVMNNDLTSAQQEIAEWNVDGVVTYLLDAGSETEFGGTGKQLPWTALSNLKIDKGFVLAGGLNCDNVSQAIENAQPLAVDVASGIEKFPGVKDHEQMERFINAAKACFTGL